MNETKVRFEKFPSFYDELSEDVKEQLEKLSSISIMDSLPDEMKRQLEQLKKQQEEWKKAMEKFPANVVIGGFSIGNEVPSKFDNFTCELVFSKDEPVGEVSPTIKGFGS